MADVSEEPKVTMPDFIRKAIIAQGKVDPDEVLAASESVDLEAPTPAEQPPLFEPPPPVEKWYDRG